MNNLQSDFHTESNANSNIDLAVKALKAGEVIAYPTEAVFGLGCDPFNQRALEKLFHVKQRPIEKGVILVAATVDQVLPFIELIDTPWQQAVLESWPGPVTWVLPLKKALPHWITGGRDTVAIRVSDHPIVQALCSEFGSPIVSSSANISGHAPAKSCAEMTEVFGDSLLCVQGALGNLGKPTQIRDALSGKILR
mgnify:CR=1 FL=1